MFVYKLFAYKRGCLQIQCLFANCVHEDRQCCSTTFQHSHRRQNQPLFPKCVFTNMSVCKVCVYKRVCLQRVCLQIYLFTNVYDYKHICSQTVCLQSVGLHTRWFTNKTVCICLQTVCSQTVCLHTLFTNLFTNAFVYEHIVYKVCLQTRNTILNHLPTPVCMFPIFCHIKIQLVF